MKLITNAPKTPQNPNNIPLYNVIDEINSGLLKGTQVDKPRAEYTDETKEHEHMCCNASTQIFFFKAPENVFTLRRTKHGIWFNQDPVGRFGYEIYANGKQHFITMNETTDINVVKFELAMIGLIAE